MFNVKYICKYFFLLLFFICSLPLTRCPLFAILIPVISIAMMIYCLGIPEFQQLYFRSSNCLFFCLLYCTLGFDDTFPLVLFCYFLGSAIRNMEIFLGIF